MAGWRKVSMHEAVVFIRDGHGQPVDGVPGWAGRVRFPKHCSENNSAIEYFSDGTAVCCRSEMNGYHSDMFEDPPEWWIYC